MDKIIGVTGFEGRLGSMLVGDPEKKLNFVPLDCDITNQASVEYSIRMVQPDIVINCAAFTNVDESESQYTHVLEINQHGVENIRQAFDGWLIQMSTDYIFGGTKGPYGEKYNVEEDFSEGKYGRSKAYGEQYVLNFPDRLGTILRTTMLYGNPNFPDFVWAILNQLKSGQPFEVPYTLIGSPTYIPHLIEGIVALIEHHWHNPPPIINIVGSDLLSRYDFALIIASVWGYDKSLILPSRKIPGKAVRPRKAGLKVGLAKQIHIPIYSVIEGLEAYKEKI